MDRIAAQRKANIKKYEEMVDLLVTTFKLESGYQALDSTVRITTEGFPEIVGEFLPELIQEMYNQGKKAGALEFQERIAAMAIY